MNITNEELGEIIASMDTVYTFVVESITIMRLRGTTATEK